MEHEIGNISIARIRQMNPSLKGINNDFVMDRSEHYIPENMNPIFKYPLRLDGIIISIREKGSAKVNINLREYDIEQNDLIICAPGDILQSMLSPGIHLSQMFLISSDFLKEMYINLNSFMPFFISLKENPKFHLMEEEVQELKSFYEPIEETVSRNDNFRTEIVRRLMGAYLYKIGSILHRKQPEFLSENPKSLKREEVLFNQFINLLSAALRRKCYESDIKLVVVKNTLLAKALEKVEKADAELVKVLEGPTSIMFANVAKAPAVLIKEFRKKSEKPVLKAAFAEGCVYVGDNQLDALCNIKSQEELIGDIIALLHSPAKNVISALQANAGQKIAGIVKTLESRNN